MLGIQPSASAKEVKKAFRTLSIALHPDKPGGGANAFAKAGAAYEVLSDPDKRAVYDQKAGHKQDASLYSEERSVVRARGCGIGTRYRCNATARAPHAPGTTLMRGWLAAPTFHPTAAA